MWVGVPIWVGGPHVNGEGIRLCNLWLANGIMGSSHMGIPHPPLCEQTDTIENIFPHYTAASKNET